MTATLDRARDAFIDAVDSDCLAYDRAAALKEAVAIEMATKRLRVAVEALAAELDGFFTGSKQGAARMAEDAMSAALDSFCYDVGTEAGALVLEAGK